MSCTACEYAQGEGEYAAYVRVGRANVMIVGCDDHLKELIERLRTAPTSDGEPSPTDNPRSDTNPKDNPNA